MHRVQRYSGVYVYALVLNAPLAVGEVPLQGGGNCKVELGVGQELEMLHGLVDKHIVGV